MDLLGYDTCSIWQRYWLNFGECGPDFSAHVHVFPPSLEAAVLCVLVAVCWIRSLRGLFFSLMPSSTTDAHQHHHRAIDSKHEAMEANGLNNGLIVAQWASVWPTCPGLMQDQQDVDDKDHLDMSLTFPLDPDSTFPDPTHLQVRLHFLKFQMFNSMLNIFDGRVLFFCLKSVKVYGCICNVSN